MLDDMNLSDLTKHADQADDLIYLNPSDIDPDPNQDRFDWDDPETIQHVQETTDSVRDQGVRRPIEIKINPENPDRWMIIAGEVRWRSAINAGLESVPCLWRKNIDDKQSSLDMLTENLNKKKLNLIELARGLQRRLDAGITREEIIKATGMSKSWISKRLKILDMEPEVVELAEKKLIIDPDNLLSINKMKADDREKTVKAVHQGKPVTALLKAYKQKKEKAQNSKTEPVSEPGALAGDEGLQGDISQTENNTSECLSISVDSIKAVISKYEPGLMGGRDLSEAWELFIEGAKE